jgi:drug/metabolite transporter (DMT)-like permease
LLYTDAVRSVLFVYLSPFVVAVGAHFFLQGDRLTFLKILGLVSAFTGIFIVFGSRPKTAKATMVLGDILQITAAFLWGATTLYIKKFMANRVEPIHTFLYQVFFSVPILLLVSIFLGPRWIYKIDPYIVASLFCQSVIVAFIALSLHLPHADLPGSLRRPFPPRGIDYLLNDRSSHRFHGDFSCELEKTHSNLM